MLREAVMLQTRDLDRPAETQHASPMTLADFPRIAIDRAVCDGRPTVAGTRMRVSDVLEMLASGTSPAEIAADFPYVSEDDVRAVSAYAAES
ncbi:MAG: DUF433 domain-containing protein [Pseudomonadota bacterium]